MATENKFVGSGGNGGPCRPPDNFTPLGFSIRKPDQIFQADLLKAVAMGQNEVPWGKWHFCPMVQLRKQFSVLWH